MVQSPKVTYHAWARDLVQALEAHQYTLLSRVYSCSSAGLLWLRQRVTQRQRTEGGGRLAHLVQRLMWQRHSVRVRRVYYSHPLSQRHAHEYVAT